MNELFLKSSKHKLDIQKHIENIHSSKDFIINLSQDKSNFQKEYEKKKDNLDWVTQAVANEIEKYNEQVRMVASELAKLKS